MATQAYEHFLALLRRKRAPALIQAAGLIDVGNFDQAERQVTSVDDSIYGAVALAGLYRDTLERARNEARVVADAPDRRAWRDEVYRRAVRWAFQALPEPHTAVEAEQFEQARAEAKAELEGIWRRGSHDAERDAALHLNAPSQEGSQ